jgi:hypothetical protein
MFAMAGLQENFPCYLLPDVVRDGIVVRIAVDVSGAQAR